VHEKVKDAFCTELVEAMKTRPSAGVAVSSTGAKNGYQLITEAVNEGAEFLFGKAELTGPTSSSLTPSILINVNPKSRINHVESFSPSATVFVVKDDQEAIRRANETEFGLAAALWTRDYKKAIQYARELEFGQVSINGSTVNADGECDMTSPKVAIPGCAQR
jgi:acyl-CoA reductase-like NAD-dependent aldehyde dehydrogenase